MSTHQKLRYVEQCSGYNHNGPAWIGYVEESKSGQTVYFNGRRFRRAHGGFGPGNHAEVGSGQPYWISGVKRRGTNRHWAGTGKIMVQAEAVSELLSLLGESMLDSSRFTVSSEIKPTNIQAFHRLENEPME